MKKIGQHLKQQTQLSSEGYINKMEGDGSQKEEINTQAQTRPTKNVDDPVQHIEEEIIVETQQTTFVIAGEIFSMDTLF